MLSKDKFPEECFNDAGAFSIELYNSYIQECAGVAEAAIRANDVEYSEHNILILADLQGLYLAMIDWLKRHNFCLESGLIPSRLVIFILRSVVDQITAREMKSPENTSITYENLLDEIFHKRICNLKNIKIITKFIPNIELFYAPAPLEEIGWNLRKRARESLSASRQLRDIDRGIVTVHNTERDYSLYKDFVDHLKRDPLISREELGFFNFFVGPDGLKFIDEKEVDIRIAIRAVDACNDYQADSLCIVSSDQDFLPVHERCSKFGIQSYHADGAKFADQKRVGRKLRELGSNYIETPIDQNWALHSITEAFAPFAIYSLSMNELEGLCNIHNGMNEVQISPHELDDGRMTLRMHRPPMPG